MSEKPKETATVLQFLQVIVLSVGLGGIFLRAGQAETKINHNISELTELKVIVQDLAKSQIGLVTTDAKHSIMLEGLRNRMDKLEAHTSNN